MSPRTDAEPRPIYEAKRFVGREKLVQEINARADQLCKGGALPSDKRITVFTGEVGIGKTWLLKHLEQSFKNKLPNYWFDLPNRNKLPTNYDATVTLIHMLFAFAREFLGKAAAERLTSIAPAELSRQIIEQVRTRLQNQCLVVFLDEVFEADWSFLELFEEYLLGPLAIEGRIMIIMAGRGRKFPWATPELRFYANFYELQPFDTIETGIQLERQQLGNAQQVEAIWQISNGVPLANLLLGQGKSIDQVIHQMLTSISVERHQIIRQNLEALCILQAFDDDRIQHLVNAYRATPRHRGTNKGPISHSESVAIRRGLVHEALAHYNKDQGAYVLDQYLRKLLDEYLNSLPNLTTWCALHGAARDLYTEWNQKYTRNALRWQAEMDYHTGYIVEGNCSDL